ncbi:hypothetical protein Q1695_013696 [Nippostrongylus brasiliensis]|nr:hypothetical protein Q1695_013696 [Nippostrongylus brasiliensis]
MLCATAADALGPALTFALSYDIAALKANASSHPDMNSEADYQKMTIAHLKEELSKRGVVPDVKAKKGELIKMLQKASAEEDAILNHSEDGAYGDPLSTPDEDLLNDDVLNDVLPDKLIEDVDDAAKITTENTTAGPTSETEKTEPPPTTKSQDKHDPLALDAKLKRAQRFGLPVGVTDPLAKAKRAERFGLATVISEKEMKAKRAERFGTTIQAAPHAKSLSSPDEETKKKLLSRAQRFGLPVNEHGKTQTSPSSPSTLDARAKRFGLKTGPAEVDEMEQKKKARLERFGAK